ncbi:HAD family hydrolase [Intrasporangium chromatireducens]|uniref:HAD family hydrolase n=1 Tax=Intrasporangium chromatireducens TaxID=1386088 RepID=UPI001F0A51BA|nr:HAD family hydrolase [Intrasporangium chromatireducens]
MAFDGEQIRGVLFDLDDTLLNHRGAARDALALWTAGAGLSEPLDVLESRWTALETHFYGRYQLGELSREEQRRARVRAFLPALTATDERADAAFSAYWIAYEHSWRPFEDARRTLVRVCAAGLAVGILTNGSLEDQRRKLERVGFMDLEIPLIASSELPAAKPDPRAFWAACSILGVTPSRCVMVGDSLEADVQGAEAAGLTPILLDRYDSHAGVPVRRVRSLDVLTQNLGAASAEGQPRLAPPARCSESPTTTASAPSTASATTSKS